VFVLVRNEIIDSLAMYLVDKMDECQVVGCETMNNSYFPQEIRIKKEILFQTLNHEVGLIAAKLNEENVKLGNPVIEDLAELYQVCSEISEEAIIKDYNNRKNYPSEI
jgi:flagellar biosynthesis/type III secretory pathway chaperone